MIERGPPRSALRAVMGRILSAIISSGNEIGELQKGKLVEFRVRWLLKSWIYEHVCNY